MGQGIAQAFAQSGYYVEVFEVSKAQIQSGLKAVETRLKTLVRLRAIDKDRADNAVARIGIAPSIEKAVVSADLVEEMVPEDLALKRKIFRQLDELSERDAILASCTSSFRISTITSEVKDRTRCVGTHWFNPAYLVPLVELVRCPETSDDVIKSTKHVLDKLGKTTIVCKDSPGFVANRIQHALNNEAMLVLQEGLASAEDIDTAVRMSFGLRLPIIGPLQTIDLSGLDTALRIRRYMQGSLRTTRFRPPRMLMEKVGLGQLGLKSGRGFYNYKGIDRESILRDRDEKLVEILRFLQDR